MKQIHNSGKGKNSRQNKNSNQKPMTGRSIFLHISLIVQHCKMSHYAACNFACNGTGKRLLNFHTTEITGCTTEAATVL